MASQYSKLLLELVTLTQHFVYFAHCAWAHDSFFDGNSARVVLLEKAVADHRFDHPNVWACHQQVSAAEENEHCYDEKGD
ncbi:hypothetical protein Tdes44962_MAKER03216 [Teratosphaeria destructans]|uniref:Uncharacterized protein n=1 Tax=Teratosphaeria destructans TaxID=418781 RepID=A0A9W7SQS0_9PEZI|nr:hypothetical protein Tdes44962_MAKER03216 [Teratosphaeria destructans]